jgi:hypothetical protein
MGHFFSPLVYREMTTHWKIGEPDHVVIFFRSLSNDWGELVGVGSNRSRHIDSLTW